MYVLQVAVVKLVVDLLLYITLTVYLVFVAQKQIAVDLVHKYFKINVCDDASRKSGEGERMSQKGGRKKEEGRRKLFLCQPSTHLGLRDGHGSQFPEGRPRHW